MVHAVDGLWLDVLARPLVWDADAGVLRLDGLALRRVRWQEDGLAFVAAPRPGDDVSLHWDFVCDVLSPAGARALHSATSRALSAVNRAPAARLAFA